MMAEKAPFDWNQEREASESMTQYFKPDLRNHPHVGNQEIIPYLNLQLASKAKRFSKIRWVPTKFSFHGGIMQRILTTSGVS